MLKLELARKASTLLRLLKVLKNKISPNQEGKKKLFAERRVELRSLDSKSNVITTTLYGVSATTDFPVQYKCHTISICMV